MTILYLAALIAVGAALLGFAVDTVTGMRFNETWSAADVSWATLIDGPVDRYESTSAPARPEGCATASPQHYERLESELEAA